MVSSRNCYNGMRYYTSARFSFTMFQSSGADESWINGLFCCPDCQVVGFEMRVIYLF